MQTESAQTKSWSWTWPSVAFGVVVVAVVGWLVVRPSADERVARSDVATLGESIAAHVGMHGELPIVGITTRTLENGDVVWGAEYLVGDQPISRAEPDRARPFFLVGSADRWCVEVQYLPVALFVDSVAPEWVAARGSGGDLGSTSKGRCGSGYTLTLSPVTETGVPAPGSAVVGPHAPVGTCFTEIIPYARSTARLEVAECGTAHFAEVYHTGVIDESDHSRFEESAAAQCAAAFRVFVGVPHNVSAFTGEPFTVSAEVWEAGDRRFSCVLFLGIADYPLVGSARDSRR